LYSQKPSSSGRGQGFTHTLLFNSMREGNLGKSAVLILEILLEGVTVAWM
jgi:hypothetical protein